MLQKNLFGYFTNFILLMILELFINIKPIESQPKYEDYFELSYNTFTSSRHLWSSPFELILDKKNLFKDSQYGYGHIKQMIDFKRSFNFKLKDNYIPYFTNNCRINFGIAVVFGEYKSSSYKFSKLNDTFLVQGLDKSVVVILRIQEKYVDILDCRNSKCNTNETPLNRTKFEELSNEINLNVNILYNAQENLLQIYKNDKNYKTELLLEQKIDLAEYLKDTNGFGYIGIASTDYQCNYGNDLYGSEIWYNGLNKITPDVRLVYNQEVFHPNDIIYIPPLKKFSLIP